MSTARPGLKEQARIRNILARLATAYPDAACSLNYTNPLELLVATILSAQCTDDRVNQITPALFARYPTAAALATADPQDLEAAIRSSGFYRNKAKSILGAARRLTAEFSGAVPDTMGALVTLPGVARKTANVVLGNAFNKAEGIVVDTHVSRVAQRLGLTRQHAPENIERDLLVLVPRNQWIAFSHRVIMHGRTVCKARQPRCAVCPLRDLCPFAALLKAQ